MDKQRYNILFTSCFSSLRGGGQRSLYLLIKYLDKDRYKPFLIVPQEDELSEETAKLGAEIFVLPFPRIRSFNIFPPVQSLFAFRRIVKKNRIDLIHTESPRELFYAAMVKMISRVPVIFHARVSDSLPWLDKMLYHLPDYIIAVSQATTNRFKLMNNQDKIRVIHNGVELDIFTPATNNYDQNRSFRVGYFGQIQRRKGIEVLIKAMNRINKEAELVIMGDGDRQYLEELKDLSNGVNVMFKDYKQNILEYIAMTDVVVLPSNLPEGLSRTIVESMAMGKLVIASDLLSNKEALGKELAEFVFPVGDDKKLADILQGITDDKRILHSMKEKIRSRAESFFDIRKNTDEIERVYDTMINS